MKKYLTLIFLIMVFGQSMLSANNIAVSNLSLTGKNTSDHYTLVQFDLSWENSFRVSTGPANWDAAWVFIKYRLPGYVSATGATSSGATITVSSTTGLRVGMPVSVQTGRFDRGTIVTAITDATTFTVSPAPNSVLTSDEANVVTGIPTWQHAWLNDVGHIAPAGSTINIGLLTPGAAFNATTNPGLGAFIYRDANGIGTNTFTGARLRWNYGANGIADNAVVDIQVYAIEMVYVPQGAFALGSGGFESGAFYKYPTPGNTYLISSEDAISVGTTNDYLYYPNTSTLSGDQTGTIPTAFPKGYNAFYCMKYEISQQGFVDFLNSLTWEQQSAHSNSPTLPAGSAALVYIGSETQIFRNGIEIMTPGVFFITPAIFACNLNFNAVYSEADDGQNIACNWLSWADVAAYLDWSGLRPMTELEFEKACRGTVAAVANEYAWGNATVYNTHYTLSGTTSGTSSEVVSNPGSSPNGNASYDETIFTWAPGINGPLRVGSFATSVSDRIVSGATYYGIMEMSGNILERPVTIGNVTGRAFTGIHGNGALDATGNADATLWPGMDGIGSGFRGGHWNGNVLYLRISDRVNAAVTSAAASSQRGYSYGGRGVRLAP